MGHGEAITSLFVLVLIRLVKCSQAWPGVSSLLPVVRADGCTARLEPNGPVRRVKAKDVLHHLQTGN